MKLFACGLAMLSSFLVAGSARGGETLEIYFIDVEIGNAVLVVTPSGEAMMMDAGSHLPTNRDRDWVLAVLKKAGVKKIDYMVATHYHNDHYGAIADLVKSDGSYTVTNQRNNYSETYEAGR